MKKIKDTLSTIDKSGWMADVLTKDINNKKSPYARALVLSAISKLENPDHIRLYNQLVNNFYNE